MTKGHTVAGRISRRLQADQNRTRKAKVIAIPAACRPSMRSVPQVKGVRIRWKPYQMSEENLVITEYCTQGKSVLTRPAAPPLAYISACRKW